MFSSLISRVEISKISCLFTWLIVDPPGSHVLFYVLIAHYLLLNGVPGNTEDGTDGACLLEDVLIFPSILLRVTFFMIGLDWVVSDLVSFRRDIMYALDWSSDGKSGEDSALAALIADDSVFSTCFSAA